MRTLVLFLLFCLALLLLATWPVAACEAQTTYLDPAGGNDANDCVSEATACKSAAKLQTLLNATAPGSQVLLKRGTTLVVTSTLTLDKTSGTAEQPIIWGAYGPDTAPRPLLDASTMGGGAMQVACKKQGYWTLQDLDFKARKGAVAWASCHHSTLQRSTISQCDQECLRIYRADKESFSSFITVKDVLITSTHRSEGIYVGTDPEQAGADTPDLTQDIVIDGVTIRGSTQAGGGGECIEFKDGTQRVTIKNSLFEDNYVPQNGCIFSARANPNSPPGNHVITNNTIRRITGDNGYGIRIRNDATISNNEVSETTQLGISLEQLSGNPTYKRVLGVKGATK